MIQASADLLFILDQDGAILDYMAGSPDRLFMSPAVFMRQKMQNILPPEAGQKIMPAIKKAHREHITVPFEYSLSLPSGERWYESRLMPLSNGQSIVFVRDVTKYKQAESKIKRQFDQLAALHAIDLAITSGLDLNLTLSMLLSHVKVQLKVDAADILLIDPNTKTLNFVAGVGFFTSALQQTHLRMGEGYAGQSALERKIIHINNLHSRDTDFLRSPAFKNESFVTYHAVPLIAKGQVLGVLEIFRRTPIKSNPDWSDFMSMLAGEAAIAIDNAMMFKNLQRSNDDLILAYDKTIEGWSRALDLRDKETENHTRRVVELTLRLARQMHIAESDLPHIRRGATLHDIGKVAISDSILLKNGPLSDAEWVLMRQHPNIAVELLTPISYLIPALDIPRFHHEKWDGSGYPEGIAGEKIPLAARLFAILDVYDALTSDRSYRLAWPHAQALEYIRSQAGKHFDPNIVPIFLEMLAEV